MFCYASKLGNCSEIQSREHIFSKNIFPEGIYIQGFEWCLDKPILIGPNSAVSKILCKTHNTLLSEYDSEAGKFFRILREMSTHETTMKNRNYYLVQKKRYNVNGFLLENWFFKTLVNIYYAKKDNQKYKINLNLLLNIIYNKEIISEPYGLSIMVAIGSKIETLDSILYTPVLDKTKNEIVGGLFKFRGVKFLLKIPLSGDITPSNIIHLEEDMRDWNSLTSLWRPNKLEMTIPNSKKKFQSIKFFW
ncbi:hypothetical protein EHQ94_19660 [Leptospira meyeri]|uniref:hypothetical protein n=1 Tax=Leptospira meyeri TaxID=29508 RepID=UPI001082D54B|nr:hypothetical protein [Leptospira meyeri]TGM62981.1 hypothetical protein EHQ94_19660 [Leptospira meyeri]TGM68627.1 hypothetical protein EHQ93_00225 [Leptospira meyeri]